MTVRILVGDCREMLHTLPDESVHMCATSPPYFGLRSYGGYEMQTLWGDASDFARPRKHPERWWTLIRMRAANKGGVYSRNQRAWVGALGLEPTPAEYVAHLVDVLREVRRVLRHDGTLWLNLGDSYAANRGRGDSGMGPKQATNVGSLLGKLRVPDGLKEKDLCGIPWRVAFALQEDGWWLRSDIVWAKPNPMPESVTDRPTKAHEYLFLLTRSPRYFFDQEAVRETMQQPDNANDGNHRGLADGGMPNIGGQQKHGRNWIANPAGRNIRSVWTIATQPYSEAHFATYPPALVEPCIKAGTSQMGVCPACGAPWIRQTESKLIPQYETRHGGYHARGNAKGMVDFSKTWKPGTLQVATTGWRPSCECDAGEPIPATVLDPFGGAGTTGLVSSRLGRDAVLIELNPTYAELAERRIADDAGPMFETVTAAPVQPQLWEVTE